MSPDQEPKRENQKEMTIDVPRKDENGNVLFTMTLNEAQVQAILQFGLNFLVSSGLAANFGIIMVDEEGPVELDD